MERLKTTKTTIGKIALFCSLMFSFYACSQSEAQQEFEDEAFQLPSGIMAMNANGNPAEDGEQDSSDWKVSPDFSSHIRIETPAFPNPVAYNSSFEIQVNVFGIDAVNGLSIYAFRQPNELILLPTISGKIHLGLNSFPISPQDFDPGQGTGTIGNTWRIILFDGQQKVISYGDVIVE